MDQFFNILYTELHIVCDKHGIPYNTRKKLLLVKIEMVSLPMSDVLLYDYSEQGIWVGNKSQGKY